MATYGISSYGTSTGSTPSDIKNLALFTLGFPDEIDFTDTTIPTVKKVNRVYETSLLFVLSNYPWRFVTRRVEISSYTTADSSYKYKYNYVLPNQLIAIKNAFYDENYSTVIREYESTPTALNTDSTTLFLEYLSIIDETLFPKYFVDYFKYKLALDLCFNLTGDTELLKLLAAQEQKQLLTSRNIDAKQGAAKTIKSSPFTQIRGR